MESKKVILMIGLFCIIGCVQKKKENLQACNSINLSFICYFDASNVSNILIRKNLKHNENIAKFNSTIYNIRKEEGSNPTRFFLDIKDSLIKGESFSLCIQKNDKTKFYYDFENIIFDTLPVYKGIVCGLEKYTLNGVEMENGNFMLSPVEGIDKKAL